MPPLPVFRSPYLSRPEFDQTAVATVFGQKRKSGHAIPVRPGDDNDKLDQLFVEIFRDGVGRRWVVANADRLGLEKYPLSKLSAATGVDGSAISRLRNEGATSLGVMALLFYHFGQSPRGLTGSEIQAAGVAAVLARVAWYYELDGRRPNRTEIASPPDDCDSLLLSAIWGAGLIPRWHALTVQYESDITAAFDDPHFLRFTRQLGQEYLRICPGLKEAERFASEHFNAPHSGNTMWLLCDRIDRNWRRYHIRLQETLDAVSHLLPSRIAKSS